ncbi:hypothetical protein [Thauera sinica]|uniref:VCBS repeat-containing protein n=1 Tax=Thauera sinica TaxID=2665146 RepID=A0ABW1AQ38_9RHOO|nr:hypothetical protein [Thauera sp. K11]ATE62217.1 hypothetical protein CCZ27_21565 [Thauera sp. K11]
MRVAASSIELQSSYVATTSLQVSERFEAWRDADGPQRTPRDAVEISAEGLAAQQAEDGGEVGAAVDAAIRNDPRLSMLIRMIEFFTGRPVRLFDASELDAGAARAAQAAQSVPQSASDAPARPRAGYGIEYDFNATYSETETTSFGASGVVRTADGEEIRFELGLSMSRSYSESTSVQFRAGDQRLKDPLMIDFAGPSAALSDLRFSFDLDADGKAEQVPLAGGRGFLAFDRNDNGRIDDGRELFGPTTGSGFGELAELDDDGNGWVDEADAGWSRLKLWQPDEAGNGRLQSLADAGIGALYVGNVSTPFSLKDAANQTIGLMRATGIYLGEDGRVGTVSQVDLSV